MKLILLIVVLSSILSINLVGQELPDTNAVSAVLIQDTAALKTKKTKEPRIPKRAVLYSAIFPGAGQIYNRKFWKAPIVYAGLGTTIYLIDYNRDFYKCLRDAYITRIGSNGLEEDKYTGIISSAEGLKNARDQFRKSMELAYFATGAIYLLQIIEAYIDAHLQSFEVSDDLSINLTPRLSNENDMVKAKIGIFIQL